jgi:hypothetical protein
MTAPKNWWTGRTFQTSLAMRLDSSWAQWAMGEAALASGETVYHIDLNGVATKPPEEVEAALLAIGGRIGLRIPPLRSDSSTRIVWVHDSACVEVWHGDGDTGIEAVTTDPDIFKALKELVEASIGARASAGRVYVLMSTDEGPKLKSIGVAATALERDNYNEEVLEAFDAVVADLKSSSPSGRLAIFDGPPGCGKTYSIRGMLAAVPDALFVLVPVALVPELANPGMISALLETRRNKGNLPTVFVIEDADHCLGTRMDGNVNAVSALLNLSDGILGAMMDIRVICTTNLKVDELDEAITRPGRLSRKVHVGPLEKGLAQKLLRKLTGNDKVKVDEKLTVAEVYTLARADGWKPVERKQSMGFKPASVDPEDEDFLVEIMLRK